MLNEGPAAKRPRSSHLQNYIAVHIDQGTGISAYPESNVPENTSPEEKWRDGDGDGSDKSNARRSRDARNSAKVRQALLKNIAKPTLGFFGTLENANMPASSHCNNQAICPPATLNMPGPHPSDPVSVADGHELSLVPVGWPNTEASAHVQVPGSTLPHPSKSLGCDAVYPAAGSRDADLNGALFNRRVARILHLSERKRNNDMQRERRLRSQLDELQALKRTNEGEEVSEIELVARQCLDERVRSGQTASLERRNLRGRMHGLSYNVERQLGLLGRRTLAFGSAMASARSSLSRNPSARLDIDKLDHLALIMISVVLDRDDFPSPDAMARYKCLADINSEIARTTAELDRAHQASCEEIAREVL
jgi:hypothetical protein